MHSTADGCDSTECGIQFLGMGILDIERSKRRFWNRLSELGIGRYVTAIERRSTVRSSCTFQVCESHANDWAPGGDTTRLCKNLHLETQKRRGDIEREILIAMLLSPVPYQFSSYDELISSVRIRQNTVVAARKTSLAFATTEAERPAEYWSYERDRGFVLRPGQPLIAALQRATQPDISGKRYTFSCRRATEYVFLLGVASVVKHCNTELYRGLHQQAETRALKGNDFENTFLRQVGSSRQPMPLKFFVPGDRTWFRNPDERSSDVTGFEGSWTFYLGDGLFADFWRQDRIYNLISKCLSIYHWRNATYRDENDELQIDERLVENLVEKTLRDSAETQRILREILQLQEPLGIYSGGCIEAHRECPRQVCPGTSDLVLPDIGFAARSAQSVA